MKFIVAFCSVLALSFSLAAAELGDSAAELKIAKWVKGEPVEILDDAKNVYVVEFWATWCPPCRTSIPHLTELQRRFKDKNVMIIGVTDEADRVVAPFVKNMGDKMDYRVVIDDNRATSKGYMQAYGINGIPHAFIVQEKKVIWHGHPMAGLDNTLQEIVDGKYDVSKAKAKLKAEGLMQQFQQAAAEGDDTKADRVAAEIQAAAREGLLPIQSFDAEAEKKRIRTMVFQNQFRGAVFQGRDDQAEDFGKKLLEVDPSANLEVLRKEALLQKDVMAYFSAITGQSEAADHQKLGKEMAPKLKGEPELANNVAWSILTDDGVKERDVALALQIAKQAGEDSNWKQPHIIDTYARALFDSGIKQEAIEYQEKAVSAASDEDKPNLERILKAYKEGKLPPEE